MIKPSPYLDVAATPTHKTDVAPLPRSTLSTILDAPERTIEDEGTAWGPFQLLRPLGRGAMGTVYEARDTVLDRHVALKVLTGRADACLREARAAARLDHPNVVAIYQIGEHNGNGFIAMQLVRGATAVHRLPMSVAESVRVIRAVAAALAYAHQQGLVHRDVKPENVLLGDDDAVKLADFGLAQAIEVKTHVSVADKVAGTPAYMSPEQAKGLRLDGKSDMYSLGATWFAMLAGKPPFLGLSVIDTLIAHVEDPAPDVRSLRPDVHMDVAELINRLLAKQPGDRPTASELIAMIDAIDLTPCPSVAPRPLHQWSRRLRWAVAAMMVGFPLGAVLALSSPVVSENGSERRDATRAQGALGAEARPDVSPEPAADAANSFGPLMTVELPESSVAKVREAVIPAGSRENRTAEPSAETTPDDPPNSETLMEPTGIKPGAMSSASENTMPSDIYPTDSSDPSRSTTIMGTGLGLISPARNAAYPGTGTGATANRGASTSTTPSAGNVSGAASASNTSAKPPARPKHPTQKQPTPNPTPRRLPRRRLPPSITPVRSTTETPGTFAFPRLLLYPSALDA